MVPVDRPGFSDETLSLIMDQQICCVPSHNGKGGHPIMLTSKEINLIVAEDDPDTPLREIVNPKYIEVNDVDLHINLDLQSDVDDWHQ
tara:strand:+ start:961 stop:1224 length:264 start_codon:yes stop_codon:yes gene_type:complete